MKKVEMIMISWKRELLTSRIGRFSFLIQKQNALTIQHSITNARQKEMCNGSHVKHGYSNEFLDSDRVANVYFTSDVDVKSRISGLNEFYRINLNDIRRAGAHDDGVFNECKISDQESDDDIASINSKDNDDDADEPLNSKFRTSIST